MTLYVNKKQLDLTAMQLHEQLRGLRPDPYAERIALQFFFVFAFLFCFYRLFASNEKMRLSVINWFVLKASRTATDGIC